MGHFFKIILQILNNVFNVDNFIIVIQAYIDRLLISAAMATVL